MRRVILVIVLAITLLSSDAARKAFVLEADDSDINIFFYSVDNPSTGIQTNISDPDNVAKTTFSKEKDTIFCIHGWLDKESSTSCQSIKDSYLQKNDVNVFVIDWDKVADDWLYPVAAAEVESLGKILGRFIKNFVETSGLDLNKTSIVGHSLGAHIAGVAGVTLDGKLNHIVGLDPAGPLFFEDDTSNRLTPSSAKFVQAIHTCGEFLGFFNPIGHADYYPNGGKSQPMCSIVDITCSHLKSLEYFTESLLTGNFKAKKCDNYNNFKNGKCDDAEESMMGEYNVDKKANGTYFLETNNKSPYAKN